MGNFEDDDIPQIKQQPANKKKNTNWTDWWVVKREQNEKLKAAIHENNSQEVISLLNDEDLISTGQQADINLKFEFQGMMLSPLMFAIRCFQPNQ